MKDLNVAIVQTSIHWEDKDKNLLMLEQKINSISEPIDLIVLPETFTTGFSMKQVSTLAEPMDGKTVLWMQNMATQKKAVLCGSVMIADNEQYYNRLLWVEPNGKVKYYDKRHLFRLAYEQNYFTAGSTQKIVELHDWKICLNICYDLRFPVWCRNKDLAYDVLLFTANWPEPRVEHWKALLKARAIENLSYVIGCNRIGEDGTGMDHTGDSACIEADGTVVAHSVEEAILYSRLSYRSLDKTRKRFAFYRDSDSFSLKA